MSGVLRLCKSPRGRLFLNLGTGFFAIGISLLAARHFAEVGWPLAHADFVLVAFSGVLFLLAYAFKAYGWRRLFAPHERPRSLTLAAAGAPRLPRRSPPGTTARAGTRTRCAKEPRRGFR